VGGVSSNVGGQERYPENDDVHLPIWEASKNALVNSLGS